MAKNYKISYKTYFNDRLKEVYFHGLQTHPLYVQITFERKTIFFKSYYFELFSKPRYFLSAARLSRGPSIKEVIAKENELIAFIIDLHPDDFSLELFKSEYAFYSKDLCDVTESSFIDYIYTFFQDKGMPVLATVLREGSKLRIAFDMVRDMKKALKPPLHDEMVENALYYAPPYLPLYGFMQQLKTWPMLSLSVMEWTMPDTQTAFTEYLKKHYPDSSGEDIKEQIQRWLAYLRKN